MPVNASDKESVFENQLKMKDIKSSLSAKRYLFFLIVDSKFSFSSSHIVTLYSNLFLFCEVATIFKMNFYNYCGPTVDTEGRDSEIFKFTKVNHLILFFGINSWAIHNIWVHFNMCKRIEVLDKFIFKHFEVLKNYEFLKKKIHSYFLTPSKMEWEKLFSSRSLFNEFYIESSRVFDECG